MIPHNQKFKRAVAVTTGAPEIGSWKVIMEKVTIARSPGALRTVLNDLETENRQGVSWAYASSRLACAECYDGAEYLPLDIDQTPSLLARRVGEYVRKRQGQSQGYRFEGLGGVLLSAHYRPASCARMRLRSGLCSITKASAGIRMYMMGEIGGVL